MNNPLPYLDCLYYGADERDRVIFGKRYCGPETFTHGGWHLVCRVEKRKGGDGQPCEIYEGRMPARFFKLVALPSESCAWPMPLQTAWSASLKIRHDFSLARFGPNAAQ